MERKINIAAILKDKPQGTKLYDWLYNIDIELDTISTTDAETVVWCTNKTDNNTICHRAYSEFGTVRGCTDGLQILLPSKEMRDWSKFAWKRGDVLVSNNGSEVLFEKFNNDEYTEFTGRYVLDLGDTVYSDTDALKTQDFKALHDGDKVKDYIAVVEKLFGGKLNRETLEIEKPQPEFKDGDIITIMPHIGDKLIYLFKTEDDEKYYGHAYLDGNIAIINEDSYCQKDFCTTRPSTEEEKQQLFAALTKEGKAWDNDKKIIVDLKPKIGFKPLEYVLSNDNEDNEWTLCQFSHFDKKGNAVFVGGNYADKDKVILHYEGNEHLLGTTNSLE